MCELYDMWIYLNKSTKKYICGSGTGRKGEKPKNKPIVPQWRQLNLSVILYNPVLKPRSLKGLTVQIREWGLGDSQGPPPTSRKVTLQEANFPKKLREEGWHGLYIFANVNIWLMRRACRFLKLLLTQFAATSPSYVLEIPPILRGWQQESK